MALLTNLKKAYIWLMATLDPVTQERTGFFIWLENKSPERFVKMKDATHNPTNRTPWVLEVLRNYRITC